MQTDPHGPSGRVRTFAELCSRLTVPGALRYLACSRLGIGSTRDGAWRLRARGVEHPLWARPGTSDLAVFRQVFGSLGYGALADQAGVGLVVDCGANVGFASAYFLSRWPGATVIAVEPDPENFRALRRTLAPYGARARAVNAGVWSHSCALAMVEAQYRDGEAWSRQVRECAPDDPGALRAVSIPELLEGSGYSRISILKVDIEGAEAVLFEGRCEWLDRVDTLAVELHDDSMFGNATEVFHRAMAGRGFELQQDGELTIARRPRAAGPR